MIDQNQTKKVLLVAGGSGGHVFPGLAIAHDLKKKGFCVLWVGTKNNIEAELIPKYGIDIKFINITGWRDKKLYTKFITLIFMFMAIYKSIRIIKYWKPNVVLGMGGYVTGPIGIAAWMCSVPLIIHEQNRRIGLTNRYLSIFAKEILSGFSNVFSSAKIVGNPIRHTILSIPHPIERWKNRTGPIRVLVIGGSKGAHILNVVMPDIALKLSGKLIIWHQVGSEDLKDIVWAYQKIKQDNNHRIVKFIDNMANAYAWADVLISRSGALTVSEVAIVGLPAIFVPFAYHQDRQQYWNALPLVKSGAAKIVEQKEFTSYYVSSILGSWNREILFDMALRAKTIAIPNATQSIVRIISEYLKE